MLKCDDKMMLTYMALCLLIPLRYFAGDYKKWCSKKKLKDTFLTHVDLSLLDFLGESLTQAKHKHVSLVLFMV